jgi:hypothetical protein
MPRKGWSGFGSSFPVCGISLPLSQKAQAQTPLFATGSVGLSFGISLRIVNSMLQSVYESLTMNKCDYCYKDIDRHIFCNTSHRVMFNRGKRMLITQKNALPTVQKISQVKQIALCKHGSMFGLCKFGCTK